MNVKNILVEGGRFTGKTTKVVDYLTNNGLTNNVLVACSGCDLEKYAKVPTTNICDQSDIERLKNCDQDFICVEDSVPMSKELTDFYCNARHYNKSVILITQKATQQLRNNSDDVWRV